MEQHVASLFAERYAVEREIGRGGMAIVYLAWDRRQMRRVALKVLRPEVASVVNTERFLREIRLTGTFQHPHILPLHDSGTDGDQPFYVMPYVDGESLRDRLAREKQLPVDDALAIAQQVADALAHAHARGVMHRDVSPGNILLATGPGEPSVFVTDFGIARAVGESEGDRLTSTGIIVGTADHMSPEQAAGDRHVDARTDVYSLGSVLYEMLAGVPPFTGPTAQAILGRKITARAPSVRELRPSLPRHVERAIARALETAPADRFASVEEFAGALRAPSGDEADAAESDPRIVSTASNPILRRRRARRRRRVAMVGGAGLLAIAAVALWMRARVDVTASERRLAAADTTRIVVLPFDAPAEQPHAELLSEAVARWRGVSLLDPFKVGDAVRQHGGHLQSNADARAVALSLGAGRYIRGRATAIGDSIHVYATLFDARDGAELSQAVAHVPRSFAGADSLYARLADSLLLRGGTGAAPAERRLGTSSLPALQAFAAAERALDDWDLVRADSLFGDAMRFDPEYARAALWLAQIRAWERLDAPRWAAVAQRALAGASHLSVREHQLAAGLVALGSGAYDRACGIYDALRQADQRDFTAWYGLGLCRDLDHVLVPDARSPSGWRFRSSYYRAVQAYAQAFELLPSVHRGLQRGSYRLLRDLLVTSSLRLRAGVRPAPDTAHMYAFPEWRGDSLVFVPLPMSEVVHSSDKTDRAAITRAVDHGRELLRSIATSWDASLPRSAGAKEAMAISLQLLGDSTAMDTLRVARSLATEPDERLRLASTEAIMMVRFALPDRDVALGKAKALADSLLNAAGAASPKRAQALLPLAMLTGRCGRAMALAREAGHPDLENVPVPQHLQVDADVLLVQALLSCPDASGLTPAARMLALSRSVNPGGGDPVTEYRLFGRTVRVLFPAESAWTVRMAAVTGDNVLMAQRSALWHDPASARDRLERIRAVRAFHPDEITEDAVYSEAVAWLALGDSTAAAHWLDTYLSTVHMYAPMVLEATDVNVASVGCLLRMMALRADLAAGREPPVARTWGRAVALLWAGADPTLGTVVRRMQSYATR